MNKYIKKTSLVALCLLFCFVTYKFGYFIAEKYFFDKFFYKKSIAHGYWVPLRKIKIKDFGERSKDIVLLQQGDKIINSIDKKQFIVAVIGDSYVWGVGIRTNQRFVSILEKKLNRIRPTKIISLGESGDSIFDYYNNYTKLVQLVIPNLSIFSLVDNDIIPNSNQQFLDDTQQIIDECEKKFPQNILTTNITFNIISQLNPKDSLQMYTDAENQASRNPVNLCAMEKAISLLPTEKSLYFIPGDYYTDNNDYTNNNDNFHSKYRNFLDKYHKYIITPAKMSHNPKYSKYWIDKTPYSYFHISQMEGHPNALANQLYADLLYQEITTNPKWGFIK